MKNRSTSSSHIPTEEEWEDYRSDLDQNYAHGTFAGRTQLEAQALIRSDPMGRIEDLGWMPGVPFRYYVIGLRDLMVANDFEDLDASDAASCFLRLVLRKLENQPHDIVSVMPELLPAVEHVAQNQSLFGADENIYGNFLDILRRIHVLHRAHGGV